MPNYHGSLGRGQQFAHSLIGKCGQLDVDDCVACIDYYTSTGVAEKDRVHVQGGSHGGFLTAHLIGMFPDKFRRAVVRNPVIAAGTMEGTTDIPDW
jgi:acylaminoacyl-peptidase